MEPRTQKIRILVVDDEQGPRESLRMILKEDYDVITASNAEEALQQIAEQAVDIVAMDIKMPNINGIELLQNVKKSNPDVEVFLVTGFPSVSTAVEAVKIGAYDYVIKPFDRDAVQAVVQRGVNRRSQNLLEKEVMGDLRLLRWV